MALTSNVTVPIQSWVTIGGGGGGTGAYSIGGGGGTGAYSIGASSFSNAYTTGTYSHTATATATVTDDLTISRPGKSTIKVGESLDMLMERLLVIEANFQKMEKYPALKEAYNNYKLIEALVSGEDNEDAV